MPKSYKVTFAHEIAMGGNYDLPIDLTRQATLPGVTPGPQTLIRSALSPVKYRDFRSFTIEHEYPLHVNGRTYDDGRPFNKIIARGEISAYQSEEKGVLLLQGKKSDILDFCRKSSHLDSVRLRTIAIDLKALQERLPEIRGVWFRFRNGYIRAKGFMGQQIQDTAEYCEAKEDGDISTLSFYFDDARDGCRHPIMITEDGTVVLQKTYKSVDDEIDFVMYVKKELLDGVYEIVEEASSMTANVAPDA